MNVGEIRALLEGKETEAGVRVSMTVGDFRSLLAGLPDDVPVMRSNWSVDRTSPEPVDLAVPEPEPAAAESAVLEELRTPAGPPADAEPREWLEEFEIDHQPALEISDSEDDGTGARCINCGWCSSGSWIHWGGTPTPTAECPDCQSTMLIFLHRRYEGETLELG